MFHRIALLVAVALLWASYARGLDDWLFPCLCVSAFVVASVLESFDYERVRGER